MVFNLHDITTDLPKLISELRPSILHRTLENIATRTEISLQLFNHWSIIRICFQNMNPKAFDSLPEARKNNLCQRFEATRRPQVALRLAKTLLQKAFGTNGTFDVLKNSILRTVCHLLKQSFPAGVLDHFLLQAVCFGNLQLFLLLFHKLIPVLSISIPFTLLYISLLVYIFLLQLSFNN